MTCSFIFNLTILSSNMTVGKKRRYGCRRCATCAQTRIPFFETQFVNEDAWFCCAVPQTGFHFDVRATEQNTNTRLGTLVRLSSSRPPFFPLYDRSLRFPLHLFLFAVCLSFSLILHRRYRNRSAIPHHIGRLRAWIYNHGN